MKERIGIAMSGGVDSTATALLLREHNAVTGFFMRLAQPDFDRQHQRVSQLADRLDIPLHVIDLKESFQQKVLDYFTRSYFAGITPNPCVLCNQEIKFGLFLQAVLAHGMERMATGHYARIVHDDAGYHLHDGVDPVKNQAYFLSRLSQEQLARILFPLGDRHKTESYSLVRHHGFTDFEGRESQDVCFLADQPVAAYLASRAPEVIRGGPVVTGSGEEIGRHQGLFRYTIGQRRGLGIPGANPWYVTGIDGASNTLIVGEAQELFKKTIILQQIHWLSGNLPDVRRAYNVRIRYSQRGARARLEVDDSPQLKIVFDEPQRAITPGQFAVISHHDEILGSGIIVN
ncbi:MAG: tRNA 2-thiouridine(34) synthase MnmA [Desulfopila sp.]